MFLFSYLQRSFSLLCFLSAFKRDECNRLKSKDELFFRQKLLRIQVAITRHTLKRLSVTCVWVLKCKELTAGILDNIINFLHYLFSSGNLTELLWNIPRNHKVNFIRFYLQGVGVKFAQSEYFRNLTFFIFSLQSIMVSQGPIRCMHLFSVTINKRTTSFTKRIEW